MVGIYTVYLDVLHANPIRRNREACATPNIEQPAASAGKASQFLTSIHVYHGDAGLPSTSDCLMLKARRIWNAWPMRFTLNKANAIEPAIPDKPIVRVSKIPRITVT